MFILAHTLTPLHPYTLRTRTSRAMRYHDYIIAEFFFAGEGQLGACTARESLALGQALSPRL